MEVSKLFLQVKIAYEASRVHRVRFTPRGFRNGDVSDVSDASDATCSNTADDWVPTVANPLLTRSYDWKERNKTHTVEKLHVASQKSGACLNTSTSSQLFFSCKDFKVKFKPLTVSVGHLV